MPQGTGRFPATSDKRRPSGPHHPGADRLYQKSSTISMSFFMLPDLTA
jgi:hypothetical protein